MRALAGLPQRTPNYRFSFVPLADVMFQLLVFFMLSSNFSAYSVLSLKTGAVTVSGTASASERAPQQGPETASQATVIWTLGPQGVIARGQQFAPDQLEPLAAAAQKQGIRDVVLITRPQVKVQDIVTVLELLNRHQITSVQIADGRLP